jgi:hypothetical protein
LGSIKRIKQELRKRGGELSNGIKSIYFKNFEVDPDISTSKVGAPFSLFICPSKYS